MKIAYTDFGNSRIKILFEEDVNSFEYSRSDEFLKYLELNKIDKIYYSSVNTTQSNQIIDSRFFDSKKYLDNSEIDFSNIKGMGFDRKIGLIAAKEKFQTPLCTIDCGSAITVNFLEANKCLGGFIIPGLKLRYKSLSELDALPEIDPKFSDLKLAENTSDAILIGVLYELCFGLKSLIKEIQKKHKIEFKNIIITGGDSAIIHKCLSVLDFWVILQKNLNLLGIKILSEKKTNDRR